MEDRLGLLTNFYITLMQAEVDRYQDTVRLLKDYYIGMEGISLISVLQKLMQRETTSNHPWATLLTKSNIYSGLIVSMTYVILHICTVFKSWNKLTLPSTKGGSKRKQSRWQVEGANDSLRLYCANNVDKGRWLNPLFEALYAKVWERCWGKRLQIVIYWNFALDKLSQAFL